MIAIVAVSCISFLSTSAFAAQESFQRDITRQVQEAKQKLQQAEAAKGAERQKLMGEHMKMMRDTMNNMQTMKPKAGMTMQEHEDYINEHQKLMEQMMEQMMGEHKLMMDMGDMPMNSGDMQKQ
jgi:Flp pilus assembly protein TadB